MRKLTCVLFIIAFIVLLVPDVTMAENNLTTGVESSDVSVERYTVKVLGTGTNEHCKFFVEIYEIWSATRVEVLLIGGDGFKKDQSVIDKIVELAREDSSITKRMETIKTYLHTVHLETDDGDAWIQCPQRCF